MPAKKKASLKKQSSTSLAHPQPRRAAPEESVTLQNHGVAPNVSEPSHSDEGSAKSSIVADGGSKDDNASPRNSAEGSNETGPSDPKQWFDQSNENPTATFDSNVMDVDPPFFQKESDTSSGDPSFLHPGRHSTQRLATVHSSSADDYRSVIDDLTIEIQNLKEELKHYKQQGPDTMKKDKLFEIKFHGLPKRKKRELEATLRDFAAGLEDSTERSSSKHKQSSRRAEILSGSGSGSKNASSSSGSRNRLVDSAYASMSTGNTSAGPSISKQVYRSHAKANDQKVENYLRDIPEGLYPRHLVLTDKDRKKLVVRRLEQLFTGKIQTPRARGKQMKLAVNGTAVGSNISTTSELTLQAPLLPAPEPKSQPLTTQGQAPSGTHEASREARIQPQDKSVVSKKSRSRQNGSSNSHGDRTESGGNGNDAASGSGNGNGNTNSSSPGSDDLPEQRPTRPNDLDPDRTQVPSENMAYMKHLGMTLPKLREEEPANLLDVAPDADGWVYLNLLCSLAQLHIINVTPKFVRIAVSEISTKFQLSPDGRKIRWRGGTEGTKLSSEGSDSPQQSSATDDSDEQQYSISRKRQKLGRATGGSGSSGQKQTKRANATSSSESFHYKPMFHRNGSSQGQTSFDGTPSSFGPVDDSNGGESRYELSGSGATSGNRKKRRHDGAIIYYSGAPFCTDLSGDPGDLSPTTYMLSSGQRTVTTDEALAPPALHRSDSGSSLSFRPLANPTLKDGMQADNEQDSGLTMASTDTDVELDLKWTDKEQFLELLPLEPSGLGGVLPDDHFMIFVKTRRSTKDATPGTPMSRFKSEDMTDGMIARLAAMSTSSPSAITVGAVTIGLSSSKSIEYISGRIKKLPAVALPPPAMFVPPFSSDESSGAVDYTEEFEDEGFESSTSHEYMSRQANPHHSDGYPDGVDLSSGDEDGENSDDDDAQGMYDVPRALEQRPSIGSAVAAPGSPRRSKSLSMEPAVATGGSSAATAGKEESDENMSSASSAA